MKSSRPVPARATHRGTAPRAAARRLALAVVALAATALPAACGNSVKIHGTADEAWDRTIATLRAQGVMPAVVPPDLERPRLDRERGEIDIPHAPSVYYGEGAAFIQIDVDAPAKRFDRTVRMWVDYPVGNDVVRFGRAIDRRESDSFFRGFTRALESLPPSSTPASPDEAPAGAPTTEGNAS